MKEVSIVIPVYGQWHLVKKNVDRNLQYDNQYIKEIIIVDDCSPDGNPYIFPDKVKVIRNGANLGYSGTVNVGLKMASSPIVVLLDSDAYPVNSYIPRLLEIYRDERVGCVGFATVDEKGNSTGNFDHEPSLFELIAGQKMNAMFKRLFVLNKKKILPFSCAVSFRKSCLEEMGYLDEKNFPVLDADNDLSLRIYQSVWKLVFAKEIEICHVGGNSIPRNHKRVVTYHQSRWRLLKKHQLIGNTTLGKFFLATRLTAEIVLLRLQSIFSRNVVLEDKLNGRRIIMKELKDY